MSQIKEWVVVVPGGASGLGRATCQALRKAGAKVCIMDLDEKNGKETVMELGTPNTMFIKTDVSMINTRVITQLPDA